MLSKVKYRNSVKKILTTILLSIPFFLFAQKQQTYMPFDPQGKFILLYTEANYKGKQMVVDVTAYTEMDLTVQRLWNNKISSIQIPVGYMLTLCDVDESKGDKLELVNNKKQAIQIPNFKKTPTNGFLKWTGDGWNENYKPQIINFDKKLSYFSILKEG
jgi:hypothetical protein